MKNLTKTLAFLALFTTYVSPVFAITTEGWEIKSFDSDIVIQQDQPVKISEKILADFSNEQHHGIARAIPYEYVNTGLTRYNARIDFVSAIDEKGKDWTTDVSRSNGFLNVEMTTADSSYLTKEGTFIVTYLANNVIGFFDETKAKQENTFPHDEFYWNVNGTDWPVNVDEVSATIHLPKAIPQDQLNLSCITGAYGAAGKDCEFSIIDAQTVLFKSTRPFAPGENLTIVVGMPVGTINPSSALTNLYYLLIENWGLLIALITLAIMYYLWRNYGRDDQSVPNTIMPHYEPPKGMSPTETGTLIDENLDPRDITATILDFAVRGYIEIKEVEEKVLLITTRDYILKLIKPYETNKDFERILLQALFPSNQAGEITSISSLKNTFYTHIPEIEKAVMTQLVTENYFPASPASTRAKYMIIGGIISSMAIGLGQNVDLSGATIIGLVLSGIIVIAFGRKMPHKTRKGTEAYYQLKGLYEYINTAEKDRMKFQEKNNIIFEKLLPYAMAFGLIDKWANAFDGIIKEPPSWYHTNHNGFTMIYFASSMNHWGTSFSNNITSRPGGQGGRGGWSGGSGFGGGFSGGGFGGGGGHGL